MWKSSDLDMVVRDWMNSHCSFWLLGTQATADEYTLNEGDQWDFQLRGKLSLSSEEMGKPSVMRSS